ncbi:MAG: hypothetical protein JWL84_2624 [Rhodospirillales bacterium]|nr:hypothetical protein [Rhodospirillales bacterium]
MADSPTAKAIYDSEIEMLSNLRELLRQETDKGKAKGIQKAILDQALAVGKARAARDGSKS